MSHRTDQPNQPDPLWLRPASDYAREIRGSVPNVELAQVRALTEALAGADQEATVGITMSGDSTLHVRIGHPDGRTDWLTVDDMAQVHRALGPRE